MENEGGWGGDGRFLKIMTSTCFSRVASPSQSSTDETCSHLFYQMSLAES